MVAFPDLLSTHMEGKPSDQTLRYRYTPIEAVDAYIAYEYLIILLDQEVRLFEIPDIVLPLSATKQLRSAAEMPDWSEGEQSLTWVQPNWSCLSLTA
jgi:hypothetical protein